MTVVDDAEITLSLTELLEILPSLIDDAIRARDDRPPDVAHALASIKTGTAVAVDDTSVEVQLDDDAPGTTVTVQPATLIAEGDRVVVLLRSGGGAYAIGNGAAQTATPVSNVVPRQAEMLRCDIDLPLNSNGSTAAWFVDESLHWTKESGDDLVDLANPSRLRFLQTGTYALSIKAQGLPASPTTFFSLFNSFDITGVLPNGVGDWSVPGGGIDLSAFLGGGARPDLGSSGALTWPFLEDQLMNFRTSIFSDISTPQLATVTYKLLVVELTGDTVRAGGGASPADYAPMFTNTRPPDAVNGVHYSYTFTADQSPAGTWSFMPGALGGAVPSGLTLTPSTGELHGTPTDATGFYTFGIQCDNGIGDPASFVFVIELT
jgi:hypothetical protein